MRRVAAVLAAGVLVLSGCSADVRDEIRGTVEDITLDANGRDVGAVRAGVDELLQLLDRAVRDGDMTAEEAERIAALAVRVRDNAELLAQVEPTPTPTTATPTPVETSASPEPTEEPEETESPEPPQDPEPTDDPEPAEPEPTVGPQLPQPTLSPASQEQPVIPTPSPTA